MARSQHQIALLLDDDQVSRWKLREPQRRRVVAGVRGGQRFREWIGQDVHADDDMTALLAEQMPAVISAHGVLLQLETTAFELGGDDLLQQLGIGLRQDQAQRATRRGRQADEQRLAHMFGLSRAFHRLSTGGRSRLPHAPRGIRGGKQ